MACEREIDRESKKEGDRVSEREIRRMREERERERVGAKDVREKEIREEACRIGTTSCI